MSINRKIILASIIYFVMCGGMCWYCLGGDIVRDLSQHRQINPGDSRQLQQDKQSYNMNQYLNQRDTQTQEVYSNNTNRFQGSLNTLSERNNTLSNQKPIFHGDAYYND